MPGRIKSTLAGITLSVGTLFLLSLAAEVIFKIWFPQTSRSFQFDPRIGYRREPGEFTSNVSNIYTVRKQVNRAGFTDGEWAMEKSSGTTRIALLGDSMTESIQVPNDKDFESRIEQKFAQKGKLVEVLNFGLSGQNTAQEYLTFKEYAITYKPDFAIFVVAITNDPSENHPKLNGRNYVPYILFEGDRETFIAPRDPSYGLPIDFLRSHSHFFRWVMSRTYDIREHLSRQKKGETQDIPVFVQNFLTKRDSSWDQAWEINEKLFEKIKNLTEENNIPLLVVVIPDRTQVYESEWDRQLDELAQKLNPNQIDREDPNKRYHAIFEKYKIPFIDFLISFRAESSQYLYVSKDVHLNESGHEYVAETLVNYLEKNLKYDILKKNEFQNRNI